jgi:hypothetical protein
VECLLSHYTPRTSLKIQNTSLSFLQRIKITYWF